MLALLLIYKLHEDVAWSSAFIFLSHVNPFLFHSSFPSGSTTQWPLPIPDGHYSRYVPGLVVATLEQFRNSYARHSLAPILPNQRRQAKTFDVGGGVDLLPWSSPAFSRYAYHITRYAQVISNAPLYVQTRPDRMLPDWLRQVWQRTARMRSKTASRFLYRSISWQTSLFWTRHLLRMWLLHLY